MPEATVRKVIVDFPHDPSKPKAGTPSRPASVAPETHPRYRSEKCRNYNGKSDSCRYGENCRFIRDLGAPRRDVRSPNKDNNKRRDSRSPRGRSPGKGGNDIGASRSPNKRDGSPRRSPRDDKGGRKRSNPPKSKGGSAGVSVEVAEQESEQSESVQTEDDYYEEDSDSSAAGLLKAGVKPTEEDS